MRNGSDIFARVVALIGGTMVVARRLRDGVPAPAFGADPAIPEAKPQGNLMTLKMPTAAGWKAGRRPVAAPDLKVQAFASGLDHPRWIEVLPNGDVLVAEASSVPGLVRTLFDYAVRSMMRRAGAMPPSANRITRLRDADGDGAAEVQEVFLEGLSQPFGMALVGDTFYVGHTDGVVAFPFAAGERRAPRWGDARSGWRAAGRRRRGKRDLAREGSIEGCGNRRRGDPGRRVTVELHRRSGQCRTRPLESTSASN